MIYIVLVVLFAYFYTSITFNPVQIADNLKKAGGVVPGITPGRSTSEYLNKILNYIVFISAVGLMIVALIPIMCTGFSMQVYHLVEHLSSLLLVLFLKQ